MHSRAPSGPDTNTEGNVMYIKNSARSILCLRKRWLTSRLGGAYKYSGLNFLLAMFILMSPAAHAACRNCNQTVELNINQQLSSSGNSVGHTENSSSFTVSGVNFGYGGSNYKSSSFTDIHGTVPEYGTRHVTEQYQALDDYFSLAVYSRSNCGTVYHPSNGPGVSSVTCQPASTSDILVPQTFYTKIRIDRPLVGGTYAKRIFVGRYGYCKGRGCSFPTQTVANVYLNYSITVPQSCVINAGEVVSVDFGNIPSTAFKSPGQRADRVNPVIRQLTMQCTNIEPFRNMSVRVQANSVSGNAIVSSNADVGFVLADTNRKELTPNNTGSSIPFMLSGANTATVPVTIWPVSVTGRTPAEGRVSAVGFLRVDFD